MRRFVFLSRNLTFGLLAIFLAFCAGTTARAQDQASITGIVTDSTGSVIPGVSVVLESTATGATYKAVTNSVGSYTIPNVPSGPGYKITFALNGFKTSVVTGLYMNVMTTRTQNAKLVVGGAAESVEVSASSQNVTLNTSDATVGNNFQVDMVNDLPIQDRDTPSALFTQQPGYAGQSITGARTDQTHVTLDGLEVDDRATGEFGSVVANAPVDSVQELRGVTTGETANLDSGGGGQFQMVTKSGTNAFHGALFEYHRDTNTEANDWFNNNEGVARPKLIRNQFGGNIGGPIKKDKAFFFFEYNGRRDSEDDATEVTVPKPSYLAGDIYYLNNSLDADPVNGPCTVNVSTCITKASASDVAKIYDPQQIGQSAALASFIAKRYTPAGNDLSYGDRLNTMGLRFNAPIKLKENNYVAKLDYTLTSSQKLWARGSLVSQRNGDDVNFSAPIQFPGDPSTREIHDSSYAWVVGHDWTLGVNKLNKFSYGWTVARNGFPSLYNPTGSLYWSSFGPLSIPYLGNYNAQARKVPVSQFRDDFSWQKGQHSIEFGGIFKYLNSSSSTINNDYSPSLGMGGNLSQLSTDERPADISSTGSTATTYWDSAMAFSLGRFAETDATFNYNADGTVAPMGLGSSRKYRNYETELYVNDSWKITPSLTLTFGLRYQLYSVPYEVNGKESISVNASTGKPLGFDEYFFKDRVAQSQAGVTGVASIPYLEYVLGGKANANSVGGYYKPSYKDFAPSVGFAWNPSNDRKSVFSGSASLKYDHTIVSAVQNFQDHNSYLFANSNNKRYGSGNGDTSLTNDPRFSSINAIPNTPAAPAFSSKETPYMYHGAPYGNAYNEFNTTIDPNLRTPYSIMLDFGYQRDLGAGFMLKLNYAGRLSRRLLAQVDGSQVIDIADSSSSELYSTAFANVTKELRAGQDPKTLPAEPWFENQVSSGIGQSYRYANNTDFVADNEANMISNGDIGDFSQTLTGPILGSIYPIVDYNEVMASQFVSNDFYTNKGFSSYNGFLVTLHKNAGYGLNFDLNYTWSHSIDNFSLVANGQSNNVGEFVCDAVRPRECRSNSDFDRTQVFNGNFIYNLPLGRGKAYAATIPLWLDEVIGGWQISGLPSFRTGIPFYANNTAYGASAANLAPAILVGSPTLVHSHVHKDAATGTVYGYSNVSKALNAFTGPIGLKLGQRNEIKGPHYTDLDLGLGKTFPMYRDKYKLVFRVDAYNALNHASFSTPNSNILSPSFGIISSTSSTARVLQGALRVEF